jgi:hypothetical protein
MSATWNPPRFPRRARLLAGVTLVLVCACASPPPASELTFVTREPGLVNPKILQQEVEGEWCFTQNVIAVSLRPPWRVRLADAGRAVSKAIDSVPGANVLTDVTVRTRLEQYLLFQRVCAVVVGDAGRME